MLALTLTTMHRSSPSSELARLVTGVPATVTGRAYLVRGRLRDRVKAKA